MPAVPGTFHFHQLHAVHSATVDRLADGGFPKRLHFEHEFWEVLAEPRDERLHQ